MKKKTFSTELAYALGLLILAFGTALMERADLGMSMVVAPAYLVHLKLSRVWTWFSFGMAEYCFQAVLIAVLTLVLRRFRRKYLFSFATAFLYGNVLDLVMKAVALIPGGGMAQRLVFYTAGMTVSAVGIALLFHSYITPEAYELFVMELSETTGRELQFIKTVYDCASCALSILLSFLFFGFMHFEGVKLGTIFCALVNGWLIGRFSALFNRHFDFRDALGWRKIFE